MLRRRELLERNERYNTAKRGREMLVNTHILQHYKQNINLHHLNETVGQLR